jgi:DNA-binding NarL/FixJ family response regulator
MTNDHTFGNAEHSRSLSKQCNSHSLTAITAMRPNTHTPPADSQVRKRSRVLLVNADPKARRLVSRALRESGSFEVIGEAVGREEAVLISSASQPDLVLLNVPANGSAVAAVARAILRNAPAARIVVVAAQESEQLALEVLRAGAAGFLGEHLDLPALVRTLKGVVAGEAAISRRLGTSLLDRAREQPERRTGMRPVKSRLTTREWEVLDLELAGIPKAAIAHELRVTLGTVRSHLRNLTRKLAMDSPEVAAGEWWRPGQGGAATK